MLEHNPDAIHPHADKLRVIETFSSLQGEGPHMGKFATFVRLSGCTVGCPYCDTKYAWGVNGGNMQTFEEVMAEINKHNNPIVILTGGEPLRQLKALDNFALRLRHTTKKLHLETSGIALTDQLYAIGDGIKRFDYIVISPKLHAKGAMYYIDLIRMLIVQNKINSCRICIKTLFADEESFTPQIPIIESAVQNGCEAVIQPLRDASATIESQRRRALEALDFVEKNTSPYLSKARIMPALHVELRLR